jgi:hypothetical protein
MQINQPNGVTRKMRERKLRSDVNWERALKQKGRKTRFGCAVKMKSTIQ